MPLPLVVKDPGAKKNYTLDFADFLEIGDSLIITGATNASTVVITLKEPPAVAFTNGQAVRIKGCQGNTSPNGLRYLKVVSSLTYELYSNVGLTTAVAGNGTHVANTGTLVKSDTISTSTWTVATGITKGADSNTLTTATVQLSGGTNGKTYDAVNHIVMTGGEEEEVTLKVFVENQ